MYTLPRRLDAELKRLPSCEPGAAGVTLPQEGAPGETAACMKLPSVRPSSGSRPCARAEELKNRFTNGMDGKPREAAILGDQGLH